MLDGKLRLTTLREYRTRDGRPYLRGYLGECKLLCFRDDRAEKVGSEEATWVVFLESSAPRADRAEPAKVERPAPARQVARTARRGQTRRSRQKTPAGPFIDDRLDDILPLPGEKAAAK